MPTSTIDQFNFQPHTIKTGAVYHYTKSNLNGSYPARVYLRVMDEATLDVWKFEAHNVDAAHITAHMDWRSFSVDRIHSWVVTRNGMQREQAVLTSSYEDTSVSVTLGGRSETVQIGHYPVHLYNFDFLSLNFILRHWSAPLGAVEIGVLQPNFDPQVDGLIQYEGTVTIRYIGEEVRNDHPCRKYSIGGRGLQDKTGLIWLDREAMYTVDMEIPVPDNPDWDSFKFQLVSLDWLEKEAWDKFIEDEIHKLNQGAKT